MDAHNCYPVNLEQVKEDIKNKRLEERKCWATLDYGFKAMYKDDEDEKPPILEYT